MNRNMAFAAALVGGVFASSVVSAAEFTGTVLGDHLNRTVPNRGACTILSPVTVGGSPWFCNYKPANPLYNEINNLLAQAGVTRLTCKIGTTTTGPDGHHAIDWLSCQAF